MENRRLVEPYDTVSITVRRYRCDGSMVVASHVAPWGREVTGTQAVDFNGLEGPVEAASYVEAVVVDLLAVLAQAGELERESVDHDLPQA